MRRKTVYGLLLIVLVMVPLTALHANGPEPSGSIFLLVNPDEESAPSPIENSLGFSYRIDLSEHFSFIPSLDFHYLRYLLRDGIPYPADPEYRDYAVTGKTTLSLPFYFDFALSPTLRSGFGLGPAFTAGYPLKIWHTEEWDETSTKTLLAYLYGKGRFFSGEAALRTEWRFRDKQAISWTLRGLFPLSRFWDGEKRPWYDGLIVQLRIGILFML